MSSARVTIHLRQTDTFGLPKVTGELDSTCKAMEAQLTNQTAYKIVSVCVLCASVPLSHIHRKQLQALTA